MSKRECARKDRREREGGMRNERVARFQRRKARLSKIVNYVNLCNCFTFSVYFGFVCLGFPNIFVCVYCSLCFVFLFSMVLSCVLLQ